jgi:hypothetical protein
MNINNTRLLIGYLLVSGLLAYLLSVMLSAIFIIGLDMDDNWCELPIEVRDGEWKCLEFKNNFEERKYDHNSDMRDRNGKLLILKFILFLGVTYIVFHFIPKWRELRHHSALDLTHTLVPLGLLSFGVSNTMPLIFAFILPTPTEWFPYIFVEIHETQREAILSELKTIAGYE